MSKPILDTSRSPYATLHTVPLPNVRLADASFWKPLCDGNIARGIPRLHGLLEQHGHMDNFRRLAGKNVERQGPLFTDSDLYKWIEAVGYVLQVRNDPELRATADAIIADIAAAQCADGYLNTYYTDESQRYTYLEHGHELYCAGHLMQGAVAYHRATGDDTLLQVACRFADHLDTVFGPGKNEKTDGHPEIELALVELYRETGEARYLRLAEFFVSRPQSYANLPPIAERPALVGHAVRSSYICCAGADLVLETGDRKLMSNLERLWEDLIGGKIYVTGGVGARYEGESFGEPYELPAARAYAETCSQIGHFMWAFRMLLITGECRYAEVMEWILYNGLRSGVSLGGDEYFYMNPLSHDGVEPPSATGHRVPPLQRSTWHGCTCCPPNVQRTLAALCGYFFTVSEQAVYVNLYDACEAELPVPGVGTVRLQVQTKYPWGEQVRITVSLDEPAEFALNLRIPSWAEGAAAIVNGSAIAPGERGKFLTIQRRWESGDTVTLHLPMRIEALQAHPRVTECRHMVALRRGPVIYCVESVDYPDEKLDLAYHYQNKQPFPVADLAIPFVQCEGVPDSLKPVWREDLLGGVMTIEGPAYAVHGGQQQLYENMAEADEEGVASAEFTAIPYYAWANRGPAAMRVWLRTTDLWKEM